MIKVCLLLTLLLGIALYAPFYIYEHALFQGIESEYLSVKKSPPALHSGGLLRMKELAVGEAATKRWTMVHFESFLLPFPVRNPHYLLFPHVPVSPGGREGIGVRFKGAQGIPLIFFESREIIPYDPRSSLREDHHSLFSLEFVRKFILSKSAKTIWEDIFSRNLHPPSPAFDRNLTDQYLDLAYNLFILNLRRHLLPNNIQTITYVKDRNLGLVSLKPKSGREHIGEEIVFILADDHIYSLWLETNGAEQHAVTYRDILLRSLNFRESSTDSAIAPFSSFQALPLSKRIDQEGMIYLFAAWSHDRQRTDFLRQMFTFGERGKGKTNVVHLDPLYEYAFKKYGNAFFQKQKDPIPEPQKSKPVEGRPLTPAERIRSLLGKAKKKKQKSDDTVLAIE